MRKEKRVYEQEGHSGLSLLIYENQVLSFGLVLALKEADFRVHKLKNSLTSLIQEPCCSQHGLSLAGFTPHNWNSVGILALS